MGDDVAKRIQVLEDIESIRKLRALYCYLVDAAVAGDASRWDDLLARFADNAWVEFELFGRYEGRDAIGTFYKEIVASSLAYSAHMVSNPIIEVDGETARGKWYVHLPCTGKAQSLAGWIQGRYDEEYVRVDGEWKWQSITTTFDHITPFDEGWVKTKFASM